MEKAGANSIFIFGLLQEGASEITVCTKCYFWVGYFCLFHPVVSSDRTLCLLDGKRICFHTAMPSPQSPAKVSVTTAIIGWVTSCYTEIAIIIEVNCCTFPLVFVLVDNFQLLNFHKLLKPLIFL